VIAYDRALDIQRTDTGTWLKKAICLNRLNRYDDALECILYLMRYDKENAEIWFQRGVAYDGKGDHLAAADALSQTLKLNADHEGAYYLRGMLLAELEQFAKAVDHFDQVIRINPDKWQAYHYKGICIIQQKEYDKALVVYEEAHNRFPTEPRLLVDQALALVMKRQPEDARQKLQRALSINPGLKDEILSTPEFSGLITDTGGQTRSSSDQ
jgi:tetratricopeptide (TPR) repeat protein